MSENSEDRYESMEIIVKQRSAVDGETWFDVIHDYITQDCEEVEDESGEVIGCTCGLESFGGMTGTLDQCYKWSTNLGNGLQPIDVAKVIAFLADPSPANSEYVKVEDRDKVIKWARDTIRFELWFDVKGWNDIEGETDSGHLEHYQVCNCLADKAICCRPNCSCKEDEDGGDQ